METLFLHLPLWFTKTFNQQAEASGAKALTQEWLFYLPPKLPHIRSSKHRAMDTPPPASHDIVALTWANQR